MTFRSLVEDILNALAWAFLPYVLIAIGIALFMLGERVGIDLFIWAGMVLAIGGVIWAALRWFFSGWFWGD
ncbi:MAG: hypothetical protein AAFV19_17260 [Pseudomonadota bacterium]